MNAPSNKLREVFEDSINNSTYLLESLGDTIGNSVSVFLDDLDRKYVTGTEGEPYLKEKYRKDYDELINETLEKIKQEFYHTVFKKKK